LELTRLRQLREQIETEKDEIVAEGRRHKAAHDKAVRAPTDITPREPTVESLLKNPQDARDEAAEETT
jgi:hypothetical protein